MNEKFVARIGEELREIETAGLFKKERGPNHGPRLKFTEES